MKFRFKQLTLVGLIIFASFFSGLSALLAETPPAEKESAKAEATKPSQPGKKVEKFIVKGREYCP